MFLKGYLGIAGTIGVGKSTFSQQLAKALGYEAALEDAAANPYLPDFYSDMKGYVTRMQIWFLSHRVREHRQIIRRIRSGAVAGVVKDRTVWEDIVFAKMFNSGPLRILSDLDYKTYLDLFDNMLLDEPIFPELLLHLDCTPETALERIKERGRGMEMGLSLDYLKALKDAYDEFIGDMRAKGARILKLDWESFVPLSECVDLVRRETKASQLLVL
jgi:deoxyadenosine/deoxycytidine kinase